MKIPSERRYRILEQPFDEMDALVSNIRCLSAGRKIAGFYRAAREIPRFGQAFEGIEAEKTRSRIAVDLHPFPHRGAGEYPEFQVVDCADADELLLHMLVELVATRQIGAGA